MGNKRRIAKTLNKSVCMAKTGITFEGCEVVLALDSPLEAKDKAKRFRIFMNRSVRRASLANIRDLTGFGLSLREKILDGEYVWN